MNEATSTFDYRNFTDHLIPTKTKDKYHCPVCEGNDFSIDPKSGAAKCWHGCEPREVREALKPWAEVLEERRGQNPDHGVTNTLPKKPAQSHKPAPLPQGKLAIARLAEVPTDIPQRAPAEVTKYIRETLQGCSVDEIKQTTVTVYDHGEGKKVRRFEAPCSESVKGHKKTFVVSHVNDLGETVCKKGNDLWRAYRQDEAVRCALSVEDGCVPVILVHEGQKCVEIARTQKLAGISAQGTPNEKEWVRILSEMKQEMGERSFVLGYMQDNDDTGTNKAEKLVQAARKIQVPVVVIDLLKIDPNLCIKGDIEQVLGNGMDGDQLAQLILEQIEQQQMQQQQEILVDEGKDEDESGEQPSVDPNNPEAPYESVCKNMGLPFENCVTETAFDTWTYHKEFSGGKDWRVINSAFFRLSDDQKCWQHQPDNRINTLIADAGERAFKLSYNKTFGWKFSKPFGTNSHKESAFKYVRSRLERPEPLPINTHLLAFSNCVVDLRTGQQMPHSKDHFLTNIIPYEYQPGKECPEVARQFIVESFGEDMLKVIRAFTRMFLDPTRPFGRFPHLIGQSGGGKGTMGRYWSNLFGEEGSGSAAEFSDLRTPEGRHQYLTGKRIIGFPDVAGFTEKVQAFYELVDNGPMSGRALFNSVTYSKQWYTRFWLASVDHVQIENAGNGWARRAYPIPVISRTVKPDPDLRVKLEACKADFISWALAMPVEECDKILTSPPESERASSLARDAAVQSDPVMSFIDLCLRPSKDTGFVENYQLHNWYTAYCREHGYKPLAQSKFISHLKGLLPHNFQDRKWSETVNGERQRIPAHWEYIVPLFPNLFVSSEPGISNTDKNPLWFCVKSQCQEGGLSDFQEFWSPKTLEAAPSIAVQIVQGEMDEKKDLGQAETLTQSGCPNCPNSPGQKSSYTRENNGQQNNFSSAVSSSMILEENLGVDRVDNLDSQSQSGFQAVQGQKLDDGQGGQGGQVDPERVSTISTPESTSKADDPRKKQWTDEQIAQFTTEESLREISGILATCDSAEKLSELRWIYPREALKQARQLLSLDKQKQIRQWTNELNRELNK